MFGSRDQLVIVMGPYLWRIGSFSEMTSGTYPFVAGSEARTMEYLTLNVTLSRPIRTKSCPTRPNIVMQSASSRVTGAVTWIVHSM